MLLSGAMGWHGSMVIVEAMEVGGMPIDEVIWLEGMAIDEAVT